ARQGCWKIAILGHCGGHARGGQHGAVQQRHRCDRRSHRHPKAKLRAANQTRGLRQITGVPLLPVPKRSERRDSREKISCHRERHHHGQCARVRTLWILNLLRDRRQLLIPRIAPQTQRESDAKDIKHWLVGRNEREKRIVVPLAETDKGQAEHRQQNENLHRGGKLPYHTYAANIDVGDSRDQRDGNHIMLPAGDLRQPELKIVGEENTVDAAQQERSGPVPPPCEESPEIPKRGASPPVEPTFHRHHAGKFARYQRYRNAPEEWQHQEIDQRQAGAGRGDHLLHAEWASGRVGVHYENEIKQPGFARCGADEVPRERWKLSRKTAGNERDYTPVARVSAGTGEEQATADSSSSSLRLISRPPP